MNSKTCIGFLSKFLSTSNGIRHINGGLHRQLSHSCRLLKAKNEDGESTSVGEKNEANKSAGKQEEKSLQQRMKEFQDHIEGEDPMHRAVRVIKEDWAEARRRLKALIKFEPPPTHRPAELEQYSEVVIIGGGGMGAACAFWIKQRVPHGISVTVIEKDPCYTTASTALSVGGIRQQFSLEENIEMSLFGAEFLRDINKYLGIDGEPPVDIGYEPHGYLTLASRKGASTLLEQTELQHKLGAKSELLTPMLIKQKFPWINTDGVELGCLGTQNEGWFDPWALLNAYRRKSVHLGAKFVRGEVVGFEYTTPDVYKKDERIELPSACIVLLPDGELKTIQFSRCIIAAGADSGHIGSLLGMGSGRGVLCCPLPVERRKRYVFCFHCPDGPGLNTPLTIDPTGTYFRREGLGGHYICGACPPPGDEPDTDNLEVDYNFFEDRIWPRLARRVPAFEKLKLKNAWAGFYEYNYLDMNGIIGPHPIYSTILFATGFTGHGIQHTPAVGRALQELIFDTDYTTLDLNRLHFDRFVEEFRLLEYNVY